ncbi:MAG TPA: DUF72 domain-containing protein [Gammaproteobacteria bacterium]|nr:DUF72 domain-containing protein [Gammaproteobacteria bacterium]
MRLYCGTSGFSFKEWKGPFYPEKLPASEMLAYYGARLPTVEINNTFYRMPKAEMLEGWAAQVPASFRFAVKAPRRISHIKQLKDCEQEAAYLFDAVAKLGERLGAVLVQLPPHAAVGVEKLERFLDCLPEAAPVAFEFRHASWRDEAVFAALRRRGAAWVTTDDEGGEPRDLPATAPWTYVRLRGPSYSMDALRAWKRRLADFDRAFVYFKHEDAAVGPALAERMIAL